MEERAVAQEWRKSREEWREAQQAKVAAAQETLARSVASLQSGEDWQRWLVWQSKLHTYSPRNVMLISERSALRGFEPSYCAGFNTWKALGRSVNKGETGLAVLAPLPTKLRVAVGDGAQRVLRRDEAPEVGEDVRESVYLRGFKIEHTFDLSQTSGDPIPTAPTPKLLEGEAPRGLGEAVMRLIESKGYEVETAPDAASLNGANGVTFQTTKRVVVRSDMDDAAMVKTLIHEAGHVILHGGPPGMFVSRHRKEIEAESVAFVVAAAHGMRTDDYSFGYVAGWTGEAKDPAREVLATQERVAQAARELLDASPAAHATGGKVPGVEAAIERQKAEREARQMVEHEPVATTAGLETV
jgi:antirestriction protein ArdC